jgi:hypothetical protein
MKLALVLVALHLSAIASEDALALLQRQAQYQKLRGESEASAAEDTVGPSHTSFRKKCGVQTECQLLFTKVSRSDLETGGEIRWEDVCTVSDGTKLDLVVTTLPGSGYSSKKPWMNGLSGVYGQINLNSKDTGFDFVFQFYKTGTYEPKTPASFYFSVFDIDGWYNHRGMRQQEVVQFSGYEYFQVTQNLELKREIALHSSVFTATTGGGYQDNPHDPLTLTEKQKARSVTFLYKNTQKFTAWFGINGPSGLGTRNVIFAGDSAIAKECSMPVCRAGFACKIKFGPLKNNNLGGKGPGSGPEEIRYENVCTAANVHSLDLVVTAAPGYDPANTKSNGVNGHYGQINVKNRKTGDFTFTFKKSGTNEDFVLDYTSFTVFDLDAGRAPNEVEVLTAGGYATYTTSNNTELIIAHPTADSLTATATKFGEYSDNPTDPLALTSLQSARSVGFDYAAVSSFKMSFGIGGGLATRGRNMLFAGDSSLNQMCHSSR